MLKGFNHKTTFRDTHRHFHLAYEISKKCPIVCGNVDLKKSNYKNAWIRTLWMICLKVSIFQKYVQNLICKNESCRMHNSELRLHLNRAFDNPDLFVHVVHGDHLFQFSP